MNDHQLRLLNSIKSFCQEYKERKISLLELQQYVGAVKHSFENDMDKKVLKSIEEFLYEIEKIYYMYEAGDQFSLVCLEINKRFN